MRWTLGPIGLAVSMMVMGTASALAADGQVTVTGMLSNPSGMTGTLTVTGLKPGAAYEFADAFEVLPRQICPQAASGITCEPRLLLGAYEATFTACSGGSVMSGVETIAPGFVRTEPQRVPSAALLSLQVASGHEAVRCDYSIRYTGTDVPAGLVASIRNDVWVLRNGMAVAHLVGPEIQVTSQPPPPIIPEAPLAILLPLTGLLSAAIGFVIFRRRTPAID